VSKFKSLLLLFGSLILLSGCSNVEVLNPKGPMASDSKFLIIYSIIFMVVIIAAVLIMFVLFLVKYRLGNNKESGKMHHNSLIELISFRGRNSNFNGEGFARQTFDVHSVSQSKFNDWVKDAKKKKVLDQDTFDKQLLPTTENKNLTFSGTHMAFVDPAADPEYVFYAYKRYNYVQKDPNFNSEKQIKEDVLSKPDKPKRKPQVTNANYERHGMKKMILRNNQPYNSEFKDSESHNMDEMEKISKGAKDKKASEIEKKDHEHGGGH
jgi:hypothetical protein